MDQIITSGKNKQEAIEKALGELGARRSEVRVEVLEAGSRGFLGMGSKDVKLRVSKSDGTGPLPEDLDPEKVARGILDPLGIDYKLEVRREEDSFYIKIASKRDEGLLIGRRGQTLDAIKHLVQRILTSQAGQTVSVNLEVGDYRERREEALRDKAEAVAAKVVESGKSLSLEPMTAQDRRIVHMSLADREDLRTYTAGDGSRRRVIVAVAGENDKPEEEREPVSPYEDIPDPSFRSTSISSMAQPRERRDEYRSSRRDGRSDRRRDGHGSEGREAGGEDRPPRRGRHERHREEGGTRIRKTFRKDNHESRESRVGREEARPSESEPQAAKHEPVATRDQTRAANKDPRTPSTESHPSRPVVRPVPVDEASAEKPFSSDLARSVLGFEETKGKTKRPKKRRYR